MELDIAEMQKRVRRGAALLDERVPGWRERIDTQRLDMGGFTSCILGQLFSSYAKGSVSIGLTDWYELYEHGFSESGFKPHFVVALTGAWKTVIAQSALVGGSA